MESVKFNMKSMSIPQARKLLQDAGCSFSRTSKHEIWKNNIGKTFSLSSNHREVSPGVVRDLIKFISGR